MTRTPTRSDLEGRRERLSAALRENLRRRKEQARRRSQSEKPLGEEPRPAPDQEPGRARPGDLATE